MPPSPALPPRPPRAHPGPAPHLPWPPTPPAQAPPCARPGSPALTVLRGGNPLANIIVVPVFVVAATALGHAFHLVLVEERLAGRALRVAAWGGCRAGRRLTSQARQCELSLHRRLCLSCPRGRQGAAGTPHPLACALSWGDEVWPPHRSLSSPSRPGRSIRQSPLGFRQVFRQGAPQGW